MALDIKKDCWGIDLGHITAQPLAPLIGSQSPSRNSDPRSFIDSYGAVSNAYPWALETTSVFGDKKSNKVLAYVVTYVFNVADQLFFIGHSLSPFIDAPMALMTHPVVGKKMCAFFKKQWPFTFPLIEAAAEQESDACVLIRVHTDRDYWFVGGILRSNNPNSVGVPEAAMTRIQGAAMTVLGDALKFPDHLPRLKQILTRGERIDEYLKVAEEAFHWAEFILGQWRDSPSGVREGCLS